MAGVPHFAILIDTETRITGGTQVNSRMCTGFYGVTYCLGFRDDFDVQITEIIDRICDLEARANPEGSEALLREIRTVAESYTHM